MTCHPMTWRALFTRPWLTVNGMVQAVVTRDPAYGTLKVENIDMSAGVVLSMGNARAHPLHLVSSTSV